MVYALTLLRQRLGCRKGMELLSTGAVTRGECCKMMRSVLRSRPENSFSATEKTYAGRNLVSSSFRSKIRTVSTTYLPFRGALDGKSPEIVRKAADGLL